MYSEGRYRLYGIERLEDRRLLSAVISSTSFNKSGQTSLTNASYILHSDDVVVRSDGKSIESGIALEKSPSSTTDDFVLARFNADGTPDKTFGNLGNGLEVINSRLAMASYVALQSDNKIVTVNVGSANDTHFTVVRYTANGMLDSTFGTGGIATIPISGATNVVAQRYCDSAGWEDRDRGGGAIWVDQQQCGWVRGSAQHKRHGGQFIWKQWAVVDWAGE